MKRITPIVIFRLGHQMVAQSSASGLPLASLTIEIHELLGKMSVNNLRCLQVVTFQVTPNVF